MIKKNSNGDIVLSKKFLEKNNISIKMIQDMLKEKKEKSKKNIETESIFLVDTISQHKITYAIKAKNESHAKDAVTCEDYEYEVNQEHIGENIVSVRKITEKEFLEESEKFNNISHLSDEKKLSSIYKIKYED